MLATIAVVAACYVPAAAAAAGFARGSRKTPPSYSKLTVSFCTCSLEVLLQHSEVPVTSTACHWRLGCAGSILKQQLNTCGSS